MDTWYVPNDKISATRLKHPYLNFTKNPFDKYDWINVSTATTQQ